jgi:copper(I)-binding protein
VNRALRAATMGVLLLSPVALSACSAGQVTQTATQERDKTGAQAQVGDITLRQVRLEEPRGGSYEAGDDAELLLAIVNGGEDTDTLVGVEGDGFSDAEISDDAIEIPRDTTVFVGENRTSVTLHDLDESLTTGQYLEITLTFENAGKIDVPVTVATPEDAEERGEAFDFHQGEGGSQEGTEDTARERESADSN